MNEAVAPLVGRAARWLSHLYALDLELEAECFVVSSQWAQQQVGGEGPRTGLLIRESEDALDLGLYVDPRDANDLGTIVEETSHLVCVAWHAGQRLPVSGLILELQGEIDRFVVARFSDRDAFAHFEHFRWAEWLDDTTRPRYETAHRRAQRYCRGLASRFPHRSQIPDMLAELRHFYRSSPTAKLRIAA